jgi:hypothetical protein
MKTKSLLTNIAIIASILLMATIGLSKDKVVQSTWITQAPRIDGMGDEWQMEVMTSEEKVGVEYAVRNDGQNMYILFIIKDPIYLSTIKSTGITMYFNTEGKKKKDHAFLFVRRQVTPDELIAYLEKRGQALTEEQKQQYREKPAYNVFMAERVGKKDIKISQPPQIPDTIWPAFKNTWREKQAIYELMIPLPQSETSPEGIGIQPGESLKVGFKWGGMTKELLERMSAGEDGRTGGIIDTRGGISGTEVGGGGGVRSPRTAPKTYSFWVDVKLASNQ